MNHDLLAVNDMLGDGLRDVGEFIDGLWMSRLGAGSNRRVHIDDFRFHGLHFSNRILTNIAFQASIYSRVTEFLDGDALLAQSSFLYKPPEAEGHGLHQDNSFIKIRGGRSCAVWIAIDDADSANGCVYAACGSSALPVLAPAELATRISYEAASNLYTDVVSGKRFPRAALEARRGSGFIWDGNILHGSLPNTSSRNRRTLVLHYVSRSAIGISEHLTPLIDRDGKKVRLQVQMPQQLA